MTTPITNSSPRATGNRVWMIREKIIFSRGYNYMPGTAALNQWDAWNKWETTNRRDLPWVKSFECVLVDLERGMVAVGRGYKNRLRKESA